MEQAKIDPVGVFPSEQWYHARLSLDFSESVMTDPIKRTEMYREAEYGLYKLFGDVGLGQDDPKPNPIPTGSYGHRFMSALFGCDVYYQKNQAPQAISLETDFDQMERMAVPDLQTSGVFRRALEDADVMRKKYGVCSGHITAGSPLNVAVSVFGENFLAACIIEPQIAGHVLRVIAETEQKLYYEYMNIMEPDVYPSDDMNTGLGYGNCPAVMVSPRVYREVVLPVDKWFRANTKTFNLHHCGVFDNYIDIYQELHPTALDIGGGSDYEAIRRVFPEVPCSLIVNAVDVETQPVSEIDSLIGRVVQTAGPVDKISSIRVIDIGTRMSDDSIRAVCTAHERI